MDEPEAPLSFTSTLSLVATLHELQTAPALRPVDWSALELVMHWREFLRQPDSYLRHLLD
jgi:hypothetical protein